MGVELLQLELGKSKPPKYPVEPDMMLQMAVCNTTLPFPEDSKHLILQMQRQLNILQVKIMVYASVRKKDIVVFNTHRAQMLIHIHCQAHMQPWPSKMNCALKTLLELLV